jgi:putative PIN family toxin of toxin-antitoxin system
MRVVLDANVVIAAAASRGLCEAVFELCSERDQIISCEGLLSEVGSKLSRKLRLPPAIVEEYVCLLRDHAEILEPEKMKAGLCRDPADDMVLGLVIPGRIDVIASGDKDLLVLKQFGASQILSPREFWEATRDGAK